VWYVTFFILKVLLLLHEQLLFLVSLREKSILKEKRKTNFRQISKLFLFAWPYQIWAEKKRQLKVLLNYWLANIPGYFKLSLLFPSLKYLCSMHYIPACHLVIQTRCQWNVLAKIWLRTLQKKIQQTLNIYFFKHDKQKWNLTLWDLKAQLFNLFLIIFLSRH
jgi:hypothetical protein